MSVNTNASFLDCVPIGSGMDWFTNSAPDGWLLCQGQAISRTTYYELFQVIGTTYGAGNGSTTFNLPDFRGRTGVGKAARGTFNNSFNNLGTTVGTTTNTLTVNQLPAHNHAILDSGHNHTITDNGHNHTINDPGHGHAYAVANATKASDFDRTHEQQAVIDVGFSVTGTENSMTGVTVNVASTGINISSSTTGIVIEDTGNDESINNIQPSLVINKIIKYR